MSCVNGHETRYSDSSLYDEVCVNCGATDGRGDDRLAEPCPNPVGRGGITASEWYDRLAGITGPQKPPEPNAGPSVWDLVIADMRERDAFGRRKYGTPLQPGNGRDALVDAYQEALDLCVYLRQAIYERDNPGAAGKSATDRDTANRPPRGPG